MTILEYSPKVNTIEVVAARSNGRQFNISVEIPAGTVEIPVAEKVYRRALIDFLSTEDIEELNRWIADRDAEAIEMQEQEAEFAEWPPLPSDQILEDMADYSSAQALANGYTLGMSAPTSADKLKEAAKTKGYESVEDFLDDASWELAQIMSGNDCPINSEDARQYVIDSEGNVNHAADVLLEDMDYSDPRQEPHFSPWFLNS